MNAKRSKGAFLYEQIRTSLQNGRYAPGERIDPAALATEFKTSQTPVRFALYRLVGEGVIHDHAREGFHVPLPTDLVLHNLYDWMERLLVMACELGFSAMHKHQDQPSHRKRDGDPVKLTRQLFENMALATEDLALYQAVLQANDRLGPIRHAKRGVFEQTLEEVVRLREHWHNHDLPSLKQGIIDYHDRRRKLVPRIVASLSAAAHARY